MKKKGISLILLVITIIVIIILAGIILLSLSQNNPIGQANKAKFINDVDIFKTELRMYLYVQILDSNGTFESKLFNASTSTTPKITDVIKSMDGKKNADTLYTDIFEVQKGELVLKSTVEKEYILEWAQEIGIGTNEKIIEKVESTSTLWQFDPETRTISGYLGNDLDTLTTITIPNYIDGIPVDKIMGNVEEYCSVLGDLYEIELLKEVIISEGITTIGEDAFCDGQYLENITIPDSVTNIEYEAFVYSGITNVQLQNNITSIGDYAFGYCEKLTSVTVENGTIGDFAFGYCTSLTNVTVENATIGEDAFGYCTSLTNVTVENGTIGESAFEYCDELTSVTIGTGVTSIGDYTFQYCDKLTSVTLGTGITSIGDNAFQYCSSLETITLPSSITTLGVGVLNNCGLISIEVDSNNTAYSSLNGILTNKAETILMQYPQARIASTYVIPLSITSIEPFAFAGCNNLTSMVIPNSITSIGNYAFRGCMSLTDITLGSGITSIEYATFENSALTSIVIPNNITSIGGFALYGCNDLTSVTIGNSVTNISGQAFSYCNSLTNITIPNSVGTISVSAFWGSGNLTSITINKPLNSIPNYPWGATNAILNWTM